MLNCFFDTSQSNKIYHKQQQEYEGKTKTYMYFIVRISIIIVGI